MIISFLHNILILAILRVSCASFSQNLTPFMLELRSESESNSGNFELDLEERTSLHLKYFFAKHLDDNFNDLSLTVKGFTSEVAMEGGNLRLRDRRRARSLDSVIFTSSVTYEGTISLKNSLVEKERLKNLQLDSFIGQSKLDYLNVLQYSSDVFLSTVNNVIVTFKEIHTEPQSSNSSTKLSLIFIIVSAIIGIVLIGSTVGIICFMRKRKTTKKKKILTKNKTKVMVTDIPDIGLASIGSVSFNTDPIPSDDFSESSDKASPPHKLGSTVKNKGAVSQSMVSTETIDMNGSVDMIAWKNQIATGDMAPFETDITMISKNSPNKTLEVKEKFHSISTNRLTKNNSLKVQEAATNDNYLSKQSLKGLSKENRFTEHSTRYHDRVYGKKRVSRKLRSAQSGYSKKNEENGNRISHTAPLVQY